MKDLSQVRESLAKKPWYNASAVSVQQKLMSLGEDCVGFLRDLEARPDVISNVRVLAMVDLLIPDCQPIFGIFSNFLVERVDDPSIVYYYQYFAWRQGEDTGTKGIILVEDKGEITHLVVNRGEKFSTGYSVYDCFGGFGEISGTKALEISEQSQKEIREELGLADVRIREIVDLGRLRVDAGMTPTYPHIFVGIIDGDEALKIKEGTTENPDILELQMGTVIVPIKKLKEFVMKNDDSFFLACLLRFATLRGSFSI